MIDAAATLPQLAQLHIGELLALRKPALIPYDGSRAVVLAHSAATHHAAAELLEAMALQLMALHSAGRARLVLYEPAPSPQFAHVKRLFAQTARHVGQQLLHKEACLQHINQLTELAHRRFALLAAAGARDIQAYNQQSAHPEATEFFLISAVLASAGHDQMLQALQSLCLQGPRVGIVPLLLRGPAELDENQSQLSRKPLQNFWSGVAAASFGFDWRGAAPQPVNQPAELWRLFNKFDVRPGLAAEACRTIANALADRTAQALEASPHTDFLRLPIGREGAQTAWFSMGEASNVYHVMMGGTSRSGKSTLVDNIILQACETFLPDELRLWLFDFSGVGFPIYEGLAHVDLLHLKQTEPAPLLAAFARFQGLIEERRSLLAQARAVRIEDYNQTSAQPLPRCLMIVDEAHNLFTDRAIKAASKHLLSFVAKEGTKFGLHLILITQSYQNVELEADVKEQFRLRVALQLATDMACRALMGRDNPAPKNLPRYSAVYNSEFGEEQHNRIIALHDLPRAELLQRLDALKTRFPAPPPASFCTTQTVTPASKPSKPAKPAKPSWDDANDPLGGL